MQIRCFLLVVVLTASTPFGLLAQGPNQAGDRALRFTFMYRKPEVRKDLEILDYQVKEINAIMDERNKLWSDAGDIDRMTNEQRREFVATLNTRNVEFERRAEDILAPHQRRRLGQIRLQELINAKGPLAGLDNEKMVVQLKLSDQQVEKIRVNGEQVAAKLKEKIDKLEREIAEARNAARRQVLAELSEEQRRIYFEAVGELTNYKLQ